MRSLQVAPLITLLSSASLIATRAERFWAGSRRPDWWRRAPGRPPGRGGGDQDDQAGGAVGQLHRQVCKCVGYEVSGAGRRRGRAAGTGRGSGRATRPRDRRHQTAARPPAPPRASRRPARSASAAPPQGSSCCRPQPPGKLRLPEDSDDHRRVLVRSYVPAPGLRPRQGVAVVLTGRGRAHGGGLAVRRRGRDRDGRRGGPFAAGPDLRWPARSVADQFFGASSGGGGAGGGEQRRVRDGGDAVGRRGRPGAHAADPGAEGGTAGATCSRTGSVMGTRARNGRCDGHLGAEPAA